MSEEIEENGLLLKECEVRIIIQVDQSCRPDRLRIFKETFIQHLKEYEEKYGMKFTLVVGAFALLQTGAQI